MKILLIEDDTFFREFYASKLKDEGYEVDTAADGVIGIEKLDKVKPDLVLLDIIMPNKDGFDVLEHKSKSPSIKHIPTIVFSTLSQESDVKRAKELGAIDYINKSFFDFENLKTKIKAVIKAK